MGGSEGLKHVVHKRVHLERPQPSGRAKLGYLEKHKDFVKRAKDYNKKQDKLKHLYRKAYFKNPDEFSVNMLQYKRQRDGALVKQEKHLDDDQLKLVDSQDARYVGMREVIDRKSVEKRKERLQFLDAEKPNKHVVFVDEEEGSSASSSKTKASSSASAKGKRKAASLEEFDVAQYFDTHPALLGRKSNRLRMKQLQTKALTDQSELLEATTQAYGELFHRQERARKLKVAREELELRKHLREKGRRKKVADAKSGDNGHPAIYKWEYKRKR